MKCVILPMAIWVISQPVFSQCMMFPLSLEEQARNSEVILEGKVTAERVFETPSGNFIYTAFRIQVTKIFKGQISGDEIELISPGGRVGSRAIRVDPSIRLQIAQVATFFLEPFRIPEDAEGSSELQGFRGYASKQSVFSYDLDSGEVKGVFDSYQGISPDWYVLLVRLTGEPVRVVRPVAFKPDPVSGARATINNFSPTTVSAGTYTEVTINGSGFGATRGTGAVEFRNADDGGATWIAASAVHYQSWNNTQIRVWVPYRAGTGKIRVNPESGSAMQSADTLNVLYSEYNFDVNAGGTDWLVQTEHQNDNGSGGITFRYHSEFNNNAAARAAFERAVNSWRCVTNVNWIIGNTTTTDVVSDDNVNVIRFDNGNELPAGTGGVTTTYADLCWTANVTSIHVTEIDMTFNNALPSPLTWQFGPALASGNEVDFESVAVHELGHAHQLSHVINTAEIMHFTVNPAENKRLPSANDLAGAADVHSRSTGNPFQCSFSAMQDYQRVKYVDAFATGIESGDNWSQAYKELQDALVGDVCTDTIFIAAGTYYPDEGEGQTDGNRAATFLIDSDVVLVGGYPPGGGPQDLSQHATILSGDIDKDGLIDAQNSRTVLRFTANGHIEGLIIQEGYADGSTGVARLGAGVRNSASPVVLNTILRNNQAPGSGSNGQGGAWYNASGTPQLTNVLLHDNTATQAGGAMYLAAGALQCTNCTYTDNVSPLGGAVFIGSSLPLLRNSIFWNNGGDIFAFSLPGPGRSSMIDLSYSMLEDAVLPAGASGMNVLLNTDPEFEDPASDLFTPGPCSPAINSGNITFNTTVADVTGNMRLIGNIDRGAYERQTLHVAPVVQNTADAGAGSLRQAIIDACPEDTITFDNALLDQTITLTGAQIYLDRNLTLQGPGMDDLFISGQGNSRIFQVSPGEVAAVKDLNIINGYVTGQNGGGIRNRGTLTLENVRMTNNTAGQDPQSLRNHQGAVLHVKGQVIIEE